MERMERHRVARNAHPRKLRPVRLRLRARRGLSVRSHESSDTRFTPSFAPPTSSSARSPPPRLHRS